MPYIKPVTIKDVQIIERLTKLIWNHNMGSFISKEQIDYMIAKSCTQEAIKKELESSKVSYVKLMEEKEMVGFGVYGITSNEGEMQVCKLNIHPDYQNKGLVKYLLEYIEKQAMQNQIEYLMLSVNRNNKQAISAYLKNGFVIEESVIIDIGNGFVMDDYIMKKPVLS
jgi:ribosomal protein S18 acetylase RimI-like enzyme